MTSVSDSLEHPAAVVVPPGLDRVRRITRLMLQPPGAIFMWVFWALQAAGLVFGFAGGTTTAIGLAFCLAGAGVATIAGRRGRFRQLRDVRLRATTRAWFWVLTPVFLWYGISLGFDRPGKPGLPPVYLLAIFVLAGLDWWRNRWWPRLALTLVWGAGCAALPWGADFFALLLGPAAPDGHPDHIRLLMFTCTAVAGIIDHCELYKLLGAADHGASSEFA